jgi:hypothetical protein
MFKCSQTNKIKILDIFYNLGEPVEWNFADQTWFTPSLAISVTIMNEKGVYRIEVQEWDTGIVIEPIYESQGIEFEDVTQTFLVESPIIYKVITQKRLGGGWKDIPGTPKKVPKNVGDWTKSPVKYVFVNGMKIK